MYTRLRIGQLGLGHWGPNLLRNFLDIDSVDVVMVCDTDPSALTRVSRHGVDGVGSTEEFFNRIDAVDAVVIATPVKTHYSLVKQALNAGKHVFVEKPVTTCVAEAVELAALAEKNGLQLMVGHVFLYNDSIRYVKKIIDAGELGEVRFIHGQRTNLGPIRQDVDALWDLAAHDVSIFNFWLGSEPESVTAYGADLLPGAQDDVVHANFVYSGGVCCQILASWMHPCKVRKITVVGDRAMLVWDDMSPLEPVRLYHKQVDADRQVQQTTGTLAEFNYTIHNGDISIPHVRLSQPLMNECRAFVNAVNGTEELLSDAATGVAVVKALSAANRSRREQSKLVPLQ